MVRNTFALEGIHCLVTSIWLIKLDVINVISLSNATKVIAVYIEIFIINVLCTIEFTLILRVAL